MPVCKANILGFKWQRGFCWDQGSQLHQLTTGNVAESLSSVCCPICSANVVFSILWIAAKFPQLCSFHICAKCSFYIVLNCDTEAVVVVMVMVMV